MKLHENTSLVDSYGIISEVYQYKRNSDIEKLKAFLEGSNYNFCSIEARSVTIINPTTNNKEILLNGTQLVRDISDGSTIFIYDGCFPFCNTHLMTKSDVIDIPVYGYSLDVRNTAITQDGTVVRLMSKELGKDIDWKAQYSAMILSKLEWDKFKQRHGLVVDDDNWKPARTEADY